MKTISKTYGKSSGRAYSDVVAGYDVPFSALDLSLSFDTMEIKSTIKNLEGEIWKDIKNYEGLYKISNYGRVKSLGRYTEYQNCLSDDRIGIKSRVNEKILKGHLCYGYHYVGLTKNGKTKGFRVHRLVADAFIPNPNNNPIINHKDENRLNNHVSNLEWCDCKYNLNYGNSRKKLSESLIKSIGVKIIQKDKKGNFIAIYNSIQEAERATGVQHQLIGKVANKKYDKQRNGKYYKRTTAGGYIWEFA